MRDQAPKDWESIAREIWDEYDMLALYLESHYDGVKMSIPFCDKILPRRFKHFNRYQGQTITAEEYKKRMDDHKLLREYMIKSFAAHTPKDIPQQDKQP